MSKFAALLVLLILSVLGVGCGDASQSTTQYIEAARAHLASGNPKSAVIELKNALQQAPRDQGARLLLGEIYLSMGDEASAQKELEQAASLGAAPDQVMPLLARAMLRQRDYAGVLALTDDQSALSRPPRYRSTRFVAWPGP